jgi:hypothetical protein
VGVQLVSAARVAFGMGSYVVVFDNNLRVLAEIRETMIIARKEKLCIK